MLFAKKRASKTPKRKPATRAQVRSIYDRPESFTSLLPWTGYDVEYQLFQLEDGISGV